MATRPTSTLRPVPPATRSLRPHTRLAVVLVLVAASAALGAPARCEEPGPDLTTIGIEAVMNMEVTSVSKRPERRMEATAAVYVITQEDIRRSGATSIPDLLRLAPGIQVARIDSNKWAVGSRGFTSRLSRSLLVLIDGRSVYSPLFAGVYWEVQDTLLEDIERIEVIRGPGATLWGANAVNGVVNIITKRAQETQGALTSLGGGETDRVLGGFRYGGRSRNRFAYRAYGKFFDRDAGFHQGTPEFDAWHMGQAGFRADRDLGEGDGLTIQGDLYDGLSGQRSVVTTYTAPYSLTVEEDAEISGGNFLGQWRHVLHDSSDLTLQFYYDRTRRREPTFQEDRDTVNLDLQHHLRAGPRHDLLWGVAYRRTSGDTSAVPTIRFIPEDRTDDLLSGFVQDEIQLAPSKATLTIGSKFEQNDYSGFEVQPNVRLLLSPRPDQVIWGSVSRALRAPSRVEHDLELTALIEPATPTFARISGNRDFRPEALLAYEIGYRVQATDRLLLDVSAFYNDYDDLLSVEPGTPFTESTPPPDHTVVPLALENKMTARVHGVELAWDWRPAPRWRLAGSHSYLQINMRRDEDSLDASTEASMEGSSPRNRTVLQSYLDLPRNLGLDVILRRITRLPGQNIDGYTEMDVSFRWRSGRNLELSVTGRNLLHRHHPEFGGGSSGLTEVERGVYGRMVWRW